MSWGWHGIPGGLGRDCGPVGEHGYDMQGRGFGNDGNRDTVMAHQFPTKQATASLAGRGVVDRPGSTGRPLLVNKREDRRQAAHMVGLQDRFD